MSFVWFPLRNWRKKNAGEDVSVLVTRENEDSVNTFDRSEGISLGELCREMEATPLFKKKEEMMLPIKEKLLQAIPVFANDPGQFKWINAADYFVCAESHDDEVAKDLQSSCFSIQRKMDRPTLRKSGFAIPSQDPMA